MPTDIDCLHHVGMVVPDIAEAVERYRSFGFAVETPSFPALPSDDGTLQPLGAAQTVARFARNFIEIVGVVTGESAVPASARLVPIQAPPEQREKVRQVVEHTMAGFTAMLARHPGLHRLVFSAADVDTVGKRLTGAGIRHSGVTTTQRPVDDGGEQRVETIRHLEVAAAGGDPADTGTLLAVAEPESVHQRAATMHPNGATDLVGAMLCIDAGRLDEVVAQYETYLDRPAIGTGGVLTFELDRATLAVVTGTELSAILPGESPAAVPSLVAYTVDVPDLPRLERFLASRDVPLARSGAGEPFIPAETALGAAIVFRSAG